MIRIAESSPRLKETRLRIARDTAAEGARRTEVQTKIAKEAATNAAYQAVFQTSELIENIVVHLPARAIFKAQRVSKGFRDSVAKSPSIRKKLFLSMRDEPAAKVVVQGQQHTAAVLKPLFETSIRKAVATYNFREDEMCGVAVAHTMHVTLESSIMDTFVLNKPFTIRKAYLECRLGENGPWVFIDRDFIRVGEEWTLRDIMRSVLSQDGHLVIMSAEAAQNYHRSYTWELNRWAGLDWARSAFEIPFVPIDALEDELNSNAAGFAWRFRVQNIPHLVIGALERLYGVPAKIYLGRQEPTFWLDNLVVPSPQDWLTIKAHQAVLRNRNA